MSFRVINLWQINGGDTWALRMKTMLYWDGFGCAWLSQFKQCLSDIAQQTWSSGLNEMSTSKRFYCHFKSLFDVESYLNCDIRSEVNMYFQNLYVAILN